MKRTVKEVTKLIGISVRTLHYYDEIGLLPPSEVTAAGYRLYDDTALDRLMQVLFFRELEVPLKDIRRILDDPAFDRRRALEQHRELLRLKRERLERLIRLADDTLKGEKEMDYNAFDMSEIEARRREYAGEAARRWGNTEAYAESERRAKGYGKEAWARAQAEADEVFRALMKLPEDDGPGLRKSAADWQAHITRWYYDCSDEILAGLGEMYAADERFREYLDGRYGAGAAARMTRAIRLFCEAK